MEISVFANVECPDGDTPRAYRELLETVQLAERLGFPAVWLTEHHFNAFSISGALPVLLAYLAGRTTHIRLGAAAFLLPMRDPVALAEDIATLDHLSDGRLLLGVAKGGPFPEQFRHFGVDESTARERMWEALSLIQRLLAGPEVSFRGAYFQCEALTIAPRPLRTHIPTWVASLTPESLARSAAEGLGIMAPSPMPAARVAELFTTYRAASPAAAPPPTLARFFLCHEDHAVARRQAAAFIHAFARRMGAVFARAPASLGMPPAAFDEEAILANAIVGDPQACRDQIEALRAQLGEHDLMLKPASDDAATSRQALALFAESVRPRLTA